MLNFLMIMAAFVVGNLVTMGLVYGVVLNKNVLKWMSKKMYGVSKEITEELLEDEFKEIASDEEA